MNEQIRKNMALFPIGTVMKLTDLTARQIRYYEQHELISPSRTSGNQRMFSYNDIERLLEIKKLIEKGVNIAGIKRVLEPAEKTSDVPNASEEPKESEDKKQKEVTDAQLHKMLKHQLLTGKKNPAQATLIQGELSRFFKS